MSSPAPKLHLRMNIGCVVYCFWRLYIHWKVAKLAASLMYTHILF